MLQVVQIASKTWDVVAWIWRLKKSRMYAARATPWRGVHSIPRVRFFLIRTAQGREKIVFNVLLSFTNENLWRTDLREHCPESFWEVRVVKRWTGWQPTHSARFARIWERKVNGHTGVELQSTLSKADTLGTKATVRLREASALERVQLQRYKCNSAGSGPNLLSGLERCPV